MIKVVLTDNQEVHVENIETVTYVEASGFFEFKDKTGNVIAVFSACAVLYYIEVAE